MSTCTQHPHTIHTGGREIEKLSYRKSEMQHVNPFTQKTREKRVREEKAKLK